MKETGNVIISKATDISSFLMEVFIEGSMSMGNLKESASTPGQMVSPTRENGLMVWSMAQECGEASRETAMLASGEWEKQRDMEFMFGLMEIDMKEILKLASNMAKEHKNLQMVTFTKANMLEASQMDTANTTGETAAITREDLKMD